MRLIEKFTRDLSSMRAQHLVYLLHVWLCVPFLLFWVTDPRVERVLTRPVTGQLRVLVVVMLVYMVVRTWLAIKDPPRLNWSIVFPPIDVLIITLILCTTHRGPMSNITLLYFLPMVQASGTLNVKWSAAVGLMVIIGTSLATVWAVPTMIQAAPTSIRALLHDDPLNVAFRVFFLLIISSLMAYQALIAAGYRERLGVAADRHRIAMEMHDGVQGHLISISSQLELISRVAEKDGAKAAQLAVEGRESARQAADELRYLVQRLRNPNLANGFEAALRQYAHNLCDRNALRLVVEVQGEVPVLDPEVENALFRISQECLTNIIKHAEANSVWISLMAEQSKVSLIVKDNGKGFSMYGSSGGAGLEGMRSRAIVNGGTLIVVSEPKLGTRLEVSFLVGPNNA